VTSVVAQLPTELVEEAQNRVRDGWNASFDQILADALRRYLHSHSTQLTEQFVLEDVEWGLHGHAVSD
jgi:hypothetical protein